jgi:hypothetical protein
MSFIGMMVSTESFCACAAVAMKRKTAGMRRNCVFIERIKKVFRKMEGYLQLSAGIQ